MYYVANEIYIHVQQVRLHVINIVAHLDAHYMYLYTCSKILLVLVTTVFKLVICDQTV